MALGGALPYCPAVPVRIVPTVVMVLLLCGCAGSAEETGKPSVVTSESDAGPARSAVVVTSEGLDEQTFWRTVEGARVRGGGDPDAMAGVLESEFAGADDETLRGFQQELVDVGARLYTWRHLNAAEMVCGFVSDDVFTDWRSWVITLGRETFVRVAEDPDNLADVVDLSGGCEGGGEIFGAAVSGIYFERHGYDDDTFPILEPVASPEGEQVTDHEAIRRAMPRLAARIRDDGLGRPPRTSG